MEKKTRQRIVSDHIEGGKAVLSRLSGALLRAFLVMVLVVTPSVLMPGVSADGKQMVALVALFVGVLTFIEYNATYPGLIEFRDAPPYNRTRFVMLFMIVFMLSVMVRDSDSPSNLSRLVEALGILVGQAMDFPYSPVRLVKLVLGEDSPQAQVQALRNAAGMSYLICWIALAVFAMLLRLRHWPSQNGVFNVWINLPTFDPTAGGDVVERLERDARVNLALGFLLPFLIPTVFKFGGMGFGALDLGSPQTMVWVITAWAFLPASLFMRGIAMGRIAGMIRDKRLRDGAVSSAEYAPA